MERIDWDRLADATYRDAFEKRYREEADEEEELTPFDLAFANDDMLEAYSIAYEDGLQGAYQTLRLTINALAEDKRIKDKDTVIEFLKRQFAFNYKLYNEVKAEMIAEGKIK